MKNAQASVFSKRVDEYSSLFAKDKLGETVPRSLNEEYINDNKESIPRQNALFLEDFDELYGLALDARTAKSTLYYYSWHSFLAFLIYTLLRYDETSRGHGMHVKPMEVDRIGVEIEHRKKQGFLSRVLDLFTILGYPISLAEKLPVVRKDHVEFIDNDISPLRKKSLSFDDIYEFNIDDFLEKHAEREKRSAQYHIADCPTRRNYGLINRYILSYIIIFISSNFERYHPHLWSIIQEGRTEFSTNVLIRTREAYQDFIPFIYMVRNDVLSRLR